MRGCVAGCCLVLECALLGGAPAPASAADLGLFINLTSEEINRATMAVFLAQKALTEKGADVVVFLNVEGVRLGDARITHATHPNGKRIDQLLLEFMQAGGKVYACPMCMQHVRAIPHPPLGGLQ